jgi:hypothetical protein
MHFPQFLELRMKLLPNLMFVIGSRPPDFAAPVRLSKENALIGQPELQDISFQSTRGSSTIRVSALIERT